METFWGKLKNESLSHYRFNNRDEASSVIREYFEIFFINCVIYFIMTFTASRLLRWLESKMDGPKDYQLVTYDPMMDPCGDIPLPTKKPKGRY